MARHVQEESLQAIEEVLRQHPEGRTASQIVDALISAPPLRTLQYRLKSLVDSKRLVMEGTSRWARYRLPPQIRVAGRAVSGVPYASARIRVVPALSKAGAEMREYVRQPPTARQPVGYDRTFLDSYRPNETFYLPQAEREHLHEVGRPVTADQPAGTYARQILNRLLIDLSWNSSRLEGNTYSLLDTMQLLELGEEAEGKQRLEAQMILNHKEAIEFLVDEAGGIGFDRHTILSLHALLADNLLADSRAAGRLRHIAVGIDGSVFYPLEDAGPHRRMLRSDSCHGRRDQRPVRQSLGEPDPFRLQHRTELREVVGRIIRGRMDKKQATAWVAAWIREHIDPEQSERFREVAERELLSLHEGNFARYRVRPSEYEAWQEVWTGEKARPRRAEERHA